MRRLRLILLLGIGHGINDWIAGFFIGTLILLKLDFFQTALALFVYNLLAFGGQYPAALLIERFQQPKRFLLIACLFNLSAAVLILFLPLLSIILAGIGSAFYHVAGGTVSAKEPKAFSIGLFAAPGVAGLILGGYMAYAKWPLFPWMILVVLALTIAIYFHSFDTKEEHKVIQQEEAMIGQHDIIMIILLTVISLRSVVWDVFQLIHENNYHWLLMIAFAAFAGKIAGGWLADKIGWRLYSIISLVLAAPLITFLKNELFFFCIGIGLLQSGIPATTSLLIRSMNNKTERAIGLSFGLAVILAALGFYTGIRTVLLPDYMTWLLSVVMIVLMFFIKEKALLKKKI
jgi:MFS transporter, FSR family, fosmidomycin resistance protein